MSLGKDIVLNKIYKKTGEENRLLVGCRIKDNGFNIRQFHCKVSVCMYRKHGSSGKELSVSL